MDLSQFNIHLGVEKVASGAFLLFIAFAIIATIVMFWHWRRYGFGMKGIILAEVVYLTGLVILLGGAFFELSFLTTNY